ncbi:aldose 1-epimerase family protein [Listeria grandensis]|uniref:aldose 1-epimerase family protein n=1 Tax=Listeria grandensis TaxID=1494963 RepID=UPI00164E8DF1|nr:aldose 1-epimerase family protein [Listeria grandensis]MBC6314696.1 aldose 1-epimerase family protein [Listeria grandensis]
MLKLENDALLVELKEDGAELTRIFDKNSEKEFLWHADGAFWGRHSPVLFPTVGRLVEDTYLVDGKPFHLGQHGFARDRIFQVTDQSEQSITLRLEADEESLLIYPFRFALEISYRLEGGTIHVGYHVVNLDDKTIYFSIGAHPAFNVPFVEGEVFEDYYLEFGATEQLDTLALSGPYLSGEKKKIADAKKLALNYDLFANDALIFEGLTKNEITIRSRKNRHFVKVAFPNFKYVGIWTPKPGTPFLCIEPWFGIADTKGASVELQDKKAMEELAVGNDFSSEYTITIG